MSDKDKFDWGTRLRLCWKVLTSGYYNPEDYRTKREQEQWEICEQRRDQLIASTRPIAECPNNDCPETEFGDQ